MTLSRHYRADPFARIPTIKCDPYGQEGQPLSNEDGQRLLKTLDSAWKLKLSNKMKGNLPCDLSREFIHPNFMKGASFLRYIATISQINDHFPSLQLERRLLFRQHTWNVVSTISCNTRVLDGLSHHDFFLAALIDVEIERPEVNVLLIPNCDSDDEEC